MNSYRTLLLSALLLLIHLPAGALSLSAEKTAYWRYELVTLTAGLGNTPTVEALPTTLQATIWQGATRVVSEGRLSHVPLGQQADGTWRGYWPIPFNPALGSYVARIDVLQSDGTTLTARCNFSVQGREPYRLPPGFSVVTDEGGKRGPNATPGLAPDEPSGWRNLVRWADYMGADALWQCIGQTQVWGRLKPEQFPWFAGNTRLMKNVGQAAHDAGLKYGAWITAFVVIGDKPEETGYQFTQGYDRKSRSLRSLRYVSLGCDKRINDLIELLKVFEAAPEVDFLGLDYMRTDFGGYEFADEFVREMSIAAPADWAQKTREEKSLWMAELIEVTRDANARDRWMWWRAHKVGQVVERIVAEVQPTKPLWVFSLGWKTGHQHGQDMGMMLDAGIGFNAPMFYSIAKPDFPSMLKDWRAYLNQAPFSVAVGECVDWNLLGRTQNPAGPTEHYDRQIMTLDRLGPASRSFGFFWHDLARAHFGARGPYGAMEWAMAGAASFSALKARAGRIPFAVTMQPPASLLPGVPGELQVVVTNPSGNTLPAVAVELVPMPRLTNLSAAPIIIDLPPRAQRTVRLALQTDQIYAPNGGRQMAAVRVQPAAGRARDPYFTFVYLPVVSPAPAAVPDGNTLSGSAQE